MERSGVDRRVHDGADQAALGAGHGQLADARFQHLRVGETDAEPQPCLAKGNGKRRVYNTSQCIMIGRTNFAINGKVKLLWFDQFTT